MYIHYGADHFDKSLFKPVKNRDIKWVKPIAGTGFWASDINAKWGWKDWCESEDFHIERLDTSFKFSLIPDARVKHIRSLNDLLDLPCIGERPVYDTDKYKRSWLMPQYYIDFEKSSEQYDAIELHLSDFYALYDILYSWDCDSILIMNPDIIMEVKE